MLEAREKPGFRALSEGLILIVLLCTEVAPQATMMAQSWQQYPKLIRVGPVMRNNMMMLQGG